jgi:hypothetical protein
MITQAAVAAADAVTPSPEFAPYAFKDAEMRLVVPNTLMAKHYSAALKRDQKLKFTVEPKPASFVGDGASIGCANLLCLALPCVDAGALAARKAPLHTMGTEMEDAYADCVNDELQRLFPDAVVQRGIDPTPGVGKPDTMMELKVGPSSSAVAMGGRARPQSPKGCAWSHIPPFALLDGSCVRQSKSQVPVVRATGRGRQRRR